MLYVPSLSANLLSVYHITHTISPKRFTFDSDSVEITKKSTGKIVAKGIANHNTNKIWHERFGHLNFKYLKQLHNDKMVEGFPCIQTSDGVCVGCLVGKNP